MLGGAFPSTLVDIVLTAWVSFVRDGKPGWPGYPSVMRLSITPTVRKGL